jgi:hypothetical protein
MKKSAATQWILVILIFISYQFTYNAQTLDATFSSPATTQCAGGLFTLNATNSSYQSYSWTISGPNAFTNNLSGSSTSLNLTEAGTYNVSLIVSDGVTSETNSVNGYLSVEAPPTVNAGVDQIICANSFATLNGSFGGTATSISWSGGSGTFSPTNANLSAIYSLSPSEIASGFVNLTITTNDPAGPCSAVTDTLIITINPAPIVNAGVDQIICANSLVTLNGYVSGSATSTTWSGGTGTFSPNIANLTATYTPSPNEIAIGFVNLVLTTNDPAGPCSAVSDTIMISFSTPPTANAGVDQTICANSFATLNGSFGGTASSATWVYLSSGTPGTFSNLLILNPTYTPSASDIANGFVNLILRTNDPAGPCSAVSDTVMIIINQVPTVTAPASICEGSTAQLSPSSGGTWTSSNAFIASISGSGIATGTSAGNVIFTFTNNATGCSNNTSTVTINSLPIVSSPSSICVGTTGQLSPATGGTWVSNNSSIATVSGIGLVTGASQGTVSFIFTNTTTLCSTTSSNLTVTIDGPSGTIAVNNTNLTGCSCFNASITVTTSGATEAKILYNDGQFVQLTPNTTQTVNYSYCNTGGSTITRTPTLYISNGTCETFIQSSQTISINPIPTVDPIPEQIVCAGELTTPITFSGSNPNITYEWVHNNEAIGLLSAGTGFIPSFQAQNTSSFPLISTFTVTPSLNGCLGTAINFTISVNPSATVNPIPDQIVCAGDSTTPITFSGSGQQYNWTNSNVNIGLAPSGTGNIAAFTAINNALNTQIATITVTPISSGCNSIPTTFTITVKPISTVNNPQDQVLCANDSTQIINFSGAALTTNYNWTNDNQSIGLNSSGSGDIPSFLGQNNSTINQTANLSVTPILDGCVGTTQTFTIIVKPIPILNPVLDETVCQNSSTQTIVFSGSNPGTVYNWTQDSPSIGCAGSGSTNFIPSFVAQNTTTAPQIATFIVAPSLNGCLGTAISFTITVMPLPTVIASPDQTVCHYDITIPVNFSGAINNTVYNWTLDNTSIGVVSSGTGNIPAFQAQNPSSGSQIANFIVTPFLDGCTGISDTFLISVNPLPLINAGNDITLCYGATFTPVATGTAITISWNNGVVQGTSFTPTVTETYIATGTNMNCYTSDSITVTVNSLPQLTISAFDGEDSLACDGTLSVLVTDGTAPYSYTWTNGLNNYTTASIQDLCSGTYSLAVVDANGCSATNSAVINDTLIPTIVGDTLIFTDNIYQDSTIIGADTSAWIENCTFDYALVTGATIDSYIDSGDSTIVTWIVALSTGSTVSVDATYFMSPGTTGVYDLTLQLYCSAKSGPKFVIASSRLYYEASTIGLETHSLNAIYLYPNPTKSTLSISGINSDFSYKIIDLQGKLLKQGANEKKIEIEQLPAGTYVIGISTDSEVKQLRFVKL